MGGEPPEYATLTVLLGQRPHRSNGTMAHMYFTDICASLIAYGVIRKLDNVFALFLRAYSVTRRRQSMTTANYEYA